MVDASSSTLDQSSVQHHIESQVHHWYSSNLGHSDVRVSCHILDDKLVIVLDNAVTQPERLLIANGRSDFAHQVRTAFDRIFRLHLQQMIETLMQVSVVDLLTATQLDTSRASVVVILSDPINPERLTADPSSLSEQTDEHGDE